jgi:hypothetical protein
LDAVSATMCVLAQPNPADHGGCRKLAIPREISCPIRPRRAGDSHFTVDILHRNTDHAVK